MTTSPSEQPKFGVRIARGLVTYWCDSPLTTWEKAEDCQRAIETWTGERGTIEEVLLSVSIATANSHSECE